MTSANAGSARPAGHAARARVRSGGLRTSFESTDDVVQTADDRSLLRGLIGDGLAMVAVVGAGLVFAGGLAIYLAVTGQLLPHDLAFLGMTRDEVGALADGRVLDFMIHDRVAWGSTLISVGTLYLWLTAFPLAAGERWAWLTVLASGIAGFAAFASYLGTGYLDEWHGIGTLLLLPVFVVGVAATRHRVHGSTLQWRPRWLGGVEAVGRVLVIATAAGLIVSGTAILAIGTTATFVASDLAFIGMSASTLETVTPRLVPLIAHDRVGFAGAVVTAGLLIGACAWWGEGPAVRQAIAVAGGVAFGATLLVHLAVGYTDLLHLAPNVVGPTVLATGVGVWSRAARHESAVGGRTEPPVTDASA